MYARLARRLSPRLASFAAVVWYGVLLALIYALWSAPQAAFRYVHL